MTDCHRCSGFLEPDGTCANFYCPNFTFKTNMNDKTESDTPETNKKYWELQGLLGTGSFEMCLDLMRKLERERDEARREATEYRNLYCVVVTDKDHLPWEK